MAEISQEWAEYLNHSISHYFQQIIEGIQRCWASMTPPLPGELENAITRKLQYKLSCDSGLRALPLRVFAQPQVVTKEDGTAVTQIDLHFQHLIPWGHDDFVWFECKRLCSWIGQRRTCVFQGAAYVDGQGQGMTAFVSRRYSAPGGHAGMLGYVLCPASSGNVLASLEDSIKLKQEVLFLSSTPPYLTECKYAQGHSMVRTSVHHNASLFIHHIILAVPPTDARLR